MPMSKRRRTCWRSSLGPKRHRIDVGGTARASEGRARALPVCVRLSPARETHAGERRYEYSSCRLLRAALHLRHRRSVAWMFIRRYAAPRALPPTPLLPESSVSRAFCPRLAEAPHLLSSVRAHLGASAYRHPLPTGMELDLLPIVEDGLFGYELVPDRRTHTYLTIGCDARGEPIVRKTLYDVGTANALRLAAANGRGCVKTQVA